MDPVDVGGGFNGGRSMTMLTRALGWRGKGARISAAGRGTSDLSVLKLVLIGAAAGMTTDPKYLSEFCLMPEVVVKHALGALQNRGVLRG